MRTVEEFKRVCALLAAQGTVVKVRSTTPSRPPPTTISGQPEAYRAALAWVRQKFPQYASYWDRVRLVTEAAIPRDAVPRDVAVGRILRGWFDRRDPGVINVVARDGHDAAKYVEALAHECAHARAFHQQTRRAYDDFSGFEGYAQIEGTDAAHRYEMDRLYEERLRRGRAS